MQAEYNQGFIDKCAELGVDPKQLVKSAARGDMLLKNLARLTMKAPSSSLVSECIGPRGNAYTPQGFTASDMLAGLVGHKVTPDSGIALALRNKPGRDAIKAVKEYGYTGAHVMNRGTEDLTALAKNVRHQNQYMKAYPGHLSEKFPAQITNDSYIDSIPGRKRYRPIESD